MKYFVIIGLGKFAIRLVEELSEIENVQVIIMDTDKDLVQECESIAAESYILDKITKENLKKVMPSEVDAVILDFEDNLDLASLVTHYVYQLNITRHIYVRTESEDHSEILETLGASKVISPSRDAAVNLTPLLISPLLSTYNVMGHGMVAVEMRVPAQFIGKTFVELDLRRQKGVNVIAVRHLGAIGYDFIGGNYRLEEGDEMMITGKAEDIENFCSAYSHEDPFSSPKKEGDNFSKSLVASFADFFKKKSK